MADEDDFAEAADGIRIGLCTGCQSVHVYLLDASDLVFAEATVSPEQWDAIVKAVERQRSELRGNDSIGPVAGSA